MTTTLLTSKLLIEAFGDPFVDAKKVQDACLSIYDVPTEIEDTNKFIPKRIYMNKFFAPIVDRWLRALIAEKVIHEITSFDGCFNIRKIRQSRGLSLHSWAVAIDFNAANNPLGLSRETAIQRGLTPFTKKFIDVSRSFVDCGADWTKRPDAMHFQMKAKDFISIR
jgi:hypothetical protein